VVAAGVAVVTFATFARAIGFGFVEWDDHRLLVDNTAYRGLGPSHLWWMATSALAGHWAPVTWLSFALDWTLWGSWPGGYHLTNVLLHAANAALVYGLAGRLLGAAGGVGPAARQAGALVCALGWALHPLRVEAVAWVTGRRDVLSGFFLLLALWAYLDAAVSQGAPRRRRLLLSVGAYALALGAKAIVMMAPVGLIVLDVYPLRRLPGDVRGWGSRVFRHVWVEKAPYVLLALLGAAAAYLGQRRGSEVITLDTGTWLGAVAVTLWQHLDKTVLPVALSPLYELPAAADWGGAEYWTRAAGVLAVTVSVGLARWRWPAGLAAWAWYLAFLAPVTAMAHAGPQLTADRYSYLPALSLALLIGAGAGVVLEGVRSGRVRRPLAAGVGGLGIVALAGLAGLSVRQVGIWRDTERLWAHAAVVTPDCAICHVNVGHALLERGRPRDALLHFARATALRPDRLGPYRSMGLALVELGRVDEALLWYERGLRLRPESLGIRVSLATALVRSGRLAEAVARLDEARRYHRPDELVRYFGAAVSARPGLPVNRLGLLQAYLALGERGRAREEYEALARLAPDLAALVAGSAAS
jgi:tetratricopeptide (TPR) repeat protein